MNPQKEKARTSKSGFLGKLPIWLSILAGIAILATVIVFIIDVLVSISGKGASLGVFGDFFGGVLNPIVSIIGFMAVLYTINNQHLDAEEQKQTTALTNKTQIKQQFEGSFFALLDSLDKELASIDQHIAPPNQNLSKKFFEIYDYCLNKCEVDRGYNCLQAALIDICTIREKANTYFSTLRIALIYIDSLYYPDLQEQTILDKNFYVELLLARQGKEKILALAYPYIAHKQSSKNTLEPKGDFSHLKDIGFFISCTSLTNLSLKPIISRLGLLRELDFSPYNYKIFDYDHDTNYARHPVTLALVETFGEQAFKPIEVPPTNP